MKVAIIHNKDLSAVINQFGIQNKEMYNPATVRRVAQALEWGGHNVAVIDGNMHMIEKLQQFMPRVIEGERMGIVFNMAYGIQGESRYTHIPSVLEMLGIPYVGSSPAGHTLALDKVTTKIIIQKHGLPTADFWVYSSPDERMDDVVYPAIVKPKMEAVSFGLRIVNNVDELRDAVAYIIEEFQQQVLVEKFIPGREFAVGLLGNNPPEALPVLEIDLEGDPNAIQTVDDKKRQPRNKICPADIPDHVAEELINLSIRAFNALHLRDFARVDFRMDEEGNIYILEINSMASLGESGSYVHSASKVGMDFKRLVNKMLDVAVVRYFTDQNFQDELEMSPNRIPLPVRVRSYLRGRQEQMESMLQQIVNINSFSRNVNGVNNIGDTVSRYLIPLGFKLQVIPQVELGNILYLSNSDSELVDVLLVSHLDGPTPLANHTYFTDGEQKLMGTGIWEYKGGLAIMVAAMQALRYIRGLKKIRIGILLTTDDTLQGKFAQPHIVNISRHASCVLGLSGASLDGGIITSRSGAASYSLYMNLKQAEQSEDVAWAMGYFSKVMHSLTELSDTMQGLVVSPWEVEMKSNITDLSAFGKAKLSIRFNEPNQLKLLEQRLSKFITKKVSKKLDFQTLGGFRRPPLIPNDKTGALVKTIKKIAGKLDIRMLEEHRWSSADICFLEKEIPVVDGLGPVGMKKPNKEEFILRHSLLERAALLTLIILELGN